MLVFSHIPRTGGTSLRAFVSERVAKAKSVDGFGEFAFLPDSELASLDFLATHCGFGIFRRVPNAKRMIVLRDPAERLVSQYYHLRALEQDVSYASQYAKTMSLASFVRVENPAVSVSVADTQLWHLIEDKNLAFRQRHRHLSDHEKVTLALDNLATYDFVGFYHDLGAVFDRLVAAFGWNDGPRPTLVPSNRPLLADLDKGDLDVLESRVPLDMELFQRAMDLFGAAPS